MDNKNETINKNGFYPVKGYEEQYLINKKGDIISLNYRGTHKEKYLSKSKNNSGYYTVHLSKDGKSKAYSVHQLVALNFVENKYNYNVVNHIDGNRTNNYYKNLEWCTQKQNCNFELAKQKYRVLGKRNMKHKERKVYQYDLNYNLIKIWDCIMDVVREGFCKSGIISHIDLKYGITTHVYKGYIWLDHEIMEHNKGN